VAARIAVTTGRSSARSRASAEERMLSALYSTLGRERTDELRAQGAARPVEELVAA
jgi:hypothetical protein